jgi:hypothetical protein
VTYKQRHASFVDPLSSRALRETRLAAKAYVERNYVRRRMGNKIAPPAKKPVA